MESFKFSLDPPLLPWEQKLVNFIRKSAITQLVYEVSSRFLHQKGVFGVRQFNCVSEICVRLTPLAMETKIWKFPHKIYHNSARI